MDSQQFAAKWRASTLKESAGYVSYFEDLCRLVEHETPTDADPSGGFFTYQRAAAKESGSAGFADVWFLRHFGWECKGKGDDLKKAYAQLLQYRDNLRNPPLLIVSDFERIEVHTNFTDTVSKTYVLTLDDIASGEPIAGDARSALAILRACFYEPDSLNPGKTRAALTVEAADLIGKVADGLRGRRLAGQQHYDPATKQQRREYSDDQIARFLSKLIFCMFAADIGLIPKGIITRVIDARASTAAQLAGRFRALFQAMKAGGDFGADPIPHFNGGLFEDPEALEIDSEFLPHLKTADQLPWSDVEPSIFGTLFERVLDPAKRRQLGKHYTSLTDIETIVTPVLMWPLERAWAALQTDVQPLLRWETQTGERRARHKAELHDRLAAFLDRLGKLRILDPACGSGNFLYVSLAMLKTLERQVIAFGSAAGLHDLDAPVHPRQLYGIELNEYAHELASIVVWIGYLQWKLRNGLPLADRTPILEPLDTIRLMDAVLDLSDPAHPREPAWPEVDVIVGNPPFLGGKRLRRELGDAYVDAMFAVWDGRVRREADFCCYWHEKARAMVETGRAKRAGLLATQAIRGGANRTTLERIKASGDIFFAASDRPWVLDGAAVRVSMVGFDDGSEQWRELDGKQVPAINADLTSVIDLTKAKRLAENAGISFMGVTRGGPFEMTRDDALKMLRAPNPHGKPNSDVVRPWLNGDDLTGRPRGMWIVDYPPHLSEADAALYEQPFQYIEWRVRPARQDASERASAHGAWWVHHRPRPAMRAAIHSLDRFIGTSMVAKHRFFVWIEQGVVCENLIIVFARNDDYFFGVLHSRAHELWVRGTGTQLREKESGSRYTPTTCFEQFPLPWTPGTEPAADPRVAAIAHAAKELNDYREQWLNPPGLPPDELKQRTLTNLYNARPQWLANAHRKLDEAVFAAYGWPPTLADADILARLLALNLARAV